jgi:flagellar hook-associated protein 3 FlgL
LRIVDLPFGDPDMDGITSGLAALSGLQTGITGDKVDSTATVTSDGSFKVRSGSREITISVLVGESIGEVAGRIDDLAGSWLDVSLSKDSSGGTVGYRLSLSPKDGSPVNVYDIEGTAAKDDLGINTDIRIKKVSDPIGGTLKVNVDGYTHTIDLSDVITGLDQVSDLINSRFSSEDVRTEIVNNTEMVIYSPAGKDISIEGNPAGMVLSETSTPERSPLSGNSPNSQNLSVRSGADYERKDLFAMLDDLSTAVRQGSDSVISESFLPRMDRAMNDVLRVRSSTGALQRRYETANNRMKENNIAFTGLYSNIMDVDMAEAAMEFQTAQTVYQATLATISKVVQPTLIDYLS